MTWGDVLVALLAGAAGGATIGFAQMFAAVLWRSWLLRREHAREHQRRETVAREWCQNCGQRLDADHPTGCVEVTK